MATPSVFQVKNRLGRGATVGQHGPYPREGQRPSPAALTATALFAASISVRKGQAAAGTDLFRARGEPAGSHCATRGTPSRQGWRGRARKRERSERGWWARRRSRSPRRRKRVGRRWRVGSRGARETLPGFPAQWDHRKRATLAESHVLMDKGVAGSAAGRPEKLSSKLKQHADLSATVGRGCVRSGERPRRPLPAQAVRAC